MKNTKEKQSDVFAILVEDGTGAVCYKTEQAFWADMELNYREPVIAEYIKERNLNKVHEYFSGGDTNILTQDVYLVEEDLS